MAVTLSTGAQVQIASAYGTSSNMTAITNAAEAVATLAAGHGVVVGDYLELTSGWDRLNGRIARAKAVSTNDVTLELIDTTDTSRYPAGSGTGSVRRITTWTPITQIQNVAASGGEQQYADITSIADFTQKQAPTNRNPVNVSLTVFDDPSLSWYATVRSASESAAVKALRMIFTNGSKLVANCYWSLQQTPNIQPNAPLTASIDMTYVADPTRYPT